MRRNSSLILLFIRCLLLCIVLFCSIGRGHAQLPMDTLHLLDGEQLIGTISAVNEENVRMILPGDGESAEIKRAEIDRVYCLTSDQMPKALVYQCPGDTSGIYIKAKALLSSAFDNEVDAIDTASDSSGQLIIKGWKILPPDQLMYWIEFNFQAQNGSYTISIKNIEVERIDGLRFSLEQLNRFGDQAPWVLHELRSFLDDFHTSMQNK